MRILLTVFYAICLMMMSSCRDASTQAIVNDSSYVNASSVKLPVSKRVFSFAYTTSNDAQQYINYNNGLNVIERTTPFAHYLQFGIHRDQRYDPRQVYLSSDVIGEDWYAVCPVNKYNAPDYMCIIYGRYRGYYIELDVATGELLQYDEIVGAIKRKLDQLN